MLQQHLTCIATSKTLFLLIVILPLASLAHYQHTAKTGFTLPRHTNYNPLTASVVVSQPPPLGDISCTIKFHTDPEHLAVLPTETVEDKAIDGWAQLKQAVGKLNHCVQLGNGGYWNYEVCFDRAVRQFHGAEEYNLGIFHSFDDDKLQAVFTNGDVCSDVTGKPSRTSKVTMLCDPLNTFKMLSISEPDICTYHIHMASNAVCGDDRFDMAEGFATDTMEDDGSEEWHLAVSKTLADDGILCQAYVHSHMHEAVFVNAEMSIRNAYVEDNYECEFLTRSVGRALSKEGEFELEGTSTKSTSSFSSKLSAIKMYCTPKTKL